MKTDIENGTKEVVVVGMSRSLTLMVIAVAAFFAMCVVFTSLLLWNFDPSITALTGGVLGVTLYVVIFMTMRYFTEQSIVYNAMNMHLKSESEK
jgi:hypothetical protein